MKNIGMNAEIPSELIQNPKNVNLEAD